MAIEQNVVFIELITWELISRIVDLLRVDHVGVDLKNS